jgi:hypothetical protein
MVWTFWLWARTGVLGRAAGGDGPQDKAAVAIRLIGHGTAPVARVEARRLQIGIGVVAGRSRRRPSIQRPIRRPSVMDANLAWAGIDGGQLAGLALGLAARLEEQELAGVADLDAPAAVERRDMEDAGHDVLS